MSNNRKPTALQTEGELATSAFESFLTLKRKKLKKQSQMK